MLTPEEFRAEHERAVARANELRPRIVRAQGWDELFLSPAVAKADFQKYLVDGWRFYYIEENPEDPSVLYTVEAHPDGEIHTIRQHGLDTSYQRRLNGDVVQTFYYTDKPPRAELITPRIGNVDHTFTNSDADFPDDMIYTLTEDPTVRYRLAFLVSHLRGKPATQGWEDTMLQNGYMPQRIGYRLIPGYALEELAGLKIQHPQVFS